MASKSWSLATGVFVVLSLFIGLLVGLGGLWVLSQQRAVPDSVVSDPALSHVRAPSSAVSSAERDQE